MLGVAYLEDSDDIRNTPAVPLIRELLARGAEVIAHDPYVREREWQLAWDGGEPVPLVAGLEAALKDADCAIVVTRHKSYVALAAEGNPEGERLAWMMKERMRTPVIVDGRNVFDRRSCERSGFVYRGVGKG